MSFRCGVAGLHVRREARGVDMEESIIEDLMPFILMFGGMIIMGVMWLIYMVRRNSSGYRDYQEYQYDKRDQESSAGYGNSMQG